MKQLLKRLVADECGQDLIEWALVATMIALGSVAVMRSYNTDMGQIFNGLSNQLINAVS